MTNLYSHWSKPAAATLFGLTPLATMIAMFGALGSVVALLVAFWAGITAFALTAVAVFVTTKPDRYGATIARRFAERSAFAMARRTKSNEYVSGPSSSIPSGRFALPGMLAQTKMHAAWLGAGEGEFAILQYPRSEVCVIVFQADPAGATLIDAEDTDLRVAGFADFLESLAGEPDLIGASVTIESVPDAGLRFQKHLLENIDPNAPELALENLREIARTFPSASSTTRGFVALAYKVATDRRNEALNQFATAIAMRLPHHLNLLKGVGGTAPFVLAPDELARLAREAFDPKSAFAIEEGRLSGTSPHLDWEDAGPAGAHADWTTYRHDTGLSHSRVMSEPPRGVVRETILARLLDPHPDIDRKRVTLLYWPLTPAASAQQAERQINMTTSMASQKRATVRTQKQVLDAQMMAHDEASGAALVKFGMTVTVTVTDPDRLPAAEAALDGLAATARVRLRPAFGAQDSAFAMCLPFGAFAVRSLASTAAARAANQPTPKPKKQKVLR